MSDHTPPTVQQVPRPQEGVGDRTPSSGTIAAVETETETPPLIRVLLVDDHEDTNRSLVLLLGRRGYRVRAATTLSAAVELAAAEPFDVLVSDMSLPDGNGIELLERLRDRPPLSGGIVVSGYNDDDDLERSRAAGYKAHMAKPVDVGKLDAMIRRIISESATA